MPWRGKKEEEKLFKKIIFLLLLVFLISPLGGCWSQKETSELAIVLGVGVDYTEEGIFRMTLQVAKPGGFSVKTTGKENEDTNWVVSAEGKTMLDAERHLAKIIPREIFWDDCIVMVLGGKMAENGTRLVTNYFQRNRGPRENMLFVITKGEAKEFLEINANLEKTSAQLVRSLLTTKTGNSVQLWKFAEMLANEGVEPTTTWIDVKKGGVIPSPEDETTSSVQKQFEVSGVGIFKKDKLIGWLDNYETAGLLWFKGEPVRDAVVVSSPDQPDKKVSIMVRRGNRKIIPQYDGQNLRFTVKVHAEGDMMEQQSTEELVKPDKIEALQKKMEEEIRNQMIFVLQKVQKEYGVDIFGFGEAFHQKYKKPWKELKEVWDTKFAAAEINVEVEAFIRETGLQGKRTSTPIE